LPGESLFHRPWRVRARRHAKRGSAFHFGEGLLSTVSGETESNFVLTTTTATRCPQHRTNSLVYISRSIVHTFPTFRHALRSCEARALRLVDINMDAQTIAINRCKGSKSSAQSLDRHKGEPLLDEVVALKAWFKERREDGSKVLFPSAKGGAMTRMQL
jgi:hypothetical protein